MFNFQQLLDMPKHKKTHTEEIKQESESGSDTAEILDLSHQEFKITMNNMLRSLTGKVYNMAKKKKKETLTKNKKEIQN